MNNKVSSPRANGAQVPDLRTMLNQPVQMLGHSLSMAHIPLKSRHTIAKKKRISQHKPNVSPESIQMNKQNKIVKYQKHLDEHRKSLTTDNFKVGHSPRNERLLQTSLSQIIK